MRIDNVNLLLSNNLVKKPEAEGLTLENTSTPSEKEKSVSEKTPAPVINAQSMFSRLMKLRLEVMAMKEMMTTTEEGSIAANNDTSGTQAETAVASAPEGVAGEAMQENMEGMLQMLDELLGMDKMAGMSESSSEDKII